MWCKSYWMLNNIFITILIFLNSGKIEVFFGYCLKAFNGGDFLIFNWANNTSHGLFILFVCQVEISPITRPPNHILSTIGKPQMSRVHQVGFIMFKSTMSELLNVEQFYHWKFNKIKIKCFREIGAKIFVLLESPWWVGFYGHNFITFFNMGSKVHFHICHL
jgi:hypothetical protein